MDWAVFLVISAAVLAVSAAAAIRLVLRKQTAGRWMTPFNMLLAGTAAAVFTALLPILRESLRDTAPGGFQVCMLTLHRTFQAFTVDIDAEAMLECVRQADTAASPVYSVYLSGLLVLAPVMTFGFILSIIRNISASVKYLTRYFSEVYAFSEPNEKTVSLAGDLKKNHPRAMLVFAGCGEEAGEWQGQAKRLGAACFTGDLLSAGLEHHSSRANITFFAASENESGNVSTALRLLDDFRGREHTFLYVDACGQEGELALSSADKGKVRVRRVNEIRNLIYHELDRQGEKLFADALTPDGAGIRQISAVILGLGRYGTEMLRALAWYGQMDGYRLTIDAFDLDSAAEDRFSALYPELTAAPFNGSSDPDDSQYTIRIHSGVDVTTKTFLDAIEQLRDTTWAFVSLGSDELNMQTAAALRQQFERMHLTHRPTILAVINRTELKNTFAELKNFRGESYEIGFIGDLQTSWSEDAIMHSALEQEALQGHLAWGEEESFWNYEYNYRSSMACAIHRKARAACGIPGTGKTEEELTEEEREILGKLEHRRWNAYMRSEGYIFSGSTDKSSRNDLGKMHHDLVSWSQLTDEAERRKDTRVAAPKA